MSTFTPKKQPAAPVKYNFSASDTDRKVLGFSGKLGSGKTTCRNYLLSMAMTYSLQLVKYAYINEAGKIVVPTVDDKETVFDIDSRDKDISNALQTNLWPYMRQFSCATPLKEFCIKVLGLEEKLVYGTQEDKNGLSNITWNRIPGYRGKRTGLMTGREVMEAVGTEVVRFMRDDAWSNALKNNILEYGSLHSIVDDVRFVDEVEALHSIGGKVIRLTKVTEESAVNTHSSNCSLDNYDKFDAVIDNQNLSIEETFVELIRVLHDFNWFKVVS